MRYPYMQLEFCLFHTLSQKLNITANKSAYPVVLRKMLLFRQDKNEISEILIYGLTLDEFTFGSMVTQKAQKSLQGLTKPFDVSTWILLFIYILIFVTYTKFLCKNSNLALVFIILDQGCQNKLKKPIYWLSMSCFILAIVLSNAYKGKVFEMISSPTFPFAPKTVNQIPNSGFTIISTLGFGNNHDGWESAVGMHIGNLMNDSRDGILCVNNLDSYVYIKENLIWSSTAPRLPVLVNLIKNGTVKNGNDTAINVRSQFVFIDLDMFVWLLEKLIYLGTQEKIFKMGDGLPFFTTRKFWSTSGTGYDDELFKKLILPTLQGFVESGLQSRWILYSSVTQTFKWLITIFKIWASSEVAGTGKISAIKTNGGQILAHLLLCRGSLKPTARLKRVDFDLLVTLVTPMIYFILFSVFILVAELLSAPFYWWVQKRNFFSVYSHYLP